jgi:hypothetical protein
MENAMKILVAILFLFTSIAQANQCESKLLAVITEAKNVVSSNFDKSENCYRAAMIGRSQGKPGCYMPDAFELKNILTPVFKKADRICTSVCKSEGKAKSCKAMVHKDFLIQVGLQGVSNKITNAPLKMDAAFIEEEEDDFSFFDI